MIFLAVGGTRNERGNNLYGTDEITDVYIFKDPQIQEGIPTKNGEIFMGVSPQNNEYEHWQLKRKHAKEPNNNPTELKQQDIHQCRYGMKKPILKLIGIKSENLIELTENLSSGDIANKTGISSIHINEMLGISKSFQPCLTDLAMAK